VLIRKGWSIWLPYDYMRSGTATPCSSDPTASAGPGTPIPNDQCTCLVFCCFDLFASHDLCVRSRATAIDEGRLHPADTWNLTSGDLWYFPANVPHTVVGMAPAGCSFVSGYNHPSFNELQAFSASSWLATVPVDALAQV